MDYKLYFLDASGRIRHRVDLQCDGDDDAVRLAADHADGRPMELWEGKRRVMAFKPKPPTSG